MFCVASAILLRRFQKTRCSFRGRRSTLDVSIVIFRGRRSTLDMSCCVFFANRCVKWRQAANSVAGVAFCEMCWKLTEGSHETSILMLQNLEVPTKTRRENVDFEATKCENWRKSRTKCSFWCSHLSRLGSLVFWWPRRVYGGSCRTSPSRRLPSRLSCRFAWQAWHFVTIQPVW